MKMGGRDRPRKIRSSRSSLNRLSNSSLRTFRSKVAARCASISSASMWTQRSTTPSSVRAIGGQTGFARWLSSIQHAFREEIGRRFRRARRPCLREEAPIYHNEPFDFWALSRHEDVQKALVNWQTFTNTRSDILDIIRAGVESAAGRDPVRGPAAAHDAPRAHVAGVHAAAHGRARGPGPRVLHPLPRPARRRRRFDIVAELGSMMPMRVIGMLLGIPEQDQVAVRNQYRRQPAHRNRASRWTSSEERVANGDMFAEYIEWRANHPSDDLMTQLLTPSSRTSTARRRTLTRQEVLTYTAVIAGAGNETTGRLIGWLAKVLAEHPEQRRAVVEDRSLIPNVIDETLRFEPTGHAIARYVTEDVEYYGTTVPAGSPILLIVAVGEPRPTSLRRSRRLQRRSATTCSTSPSATGSTSASARASPGSRAGSHSTSC